MSRNIKIISQPTESIIMLMTESWYANKESSSLTTQQWNGREEEEMIPSVNHQQNVFSVPFNLPSPSQKVSWRGGFYFYLNTLCYIH